ncbi:glycosyltransferase family 1 protein [Desulfosporosinus sp.]|uniref:glycosyltransferase family 1 protein n=1 Tax=Desulfosporosinus sp. TaxID=157907 RepID=UPI0023124168|nr:glycosyltransferase family 1 protein [Desulfosporosinus sp.]MDA8220383.1 glycosyltransferase family 1 protein [Desulfitobacterium hafniense]
MQKKEISNDIAWLLEHGLITEAEESLRQYCEFFPDDVEGYSLQAGLHLSKGNACDAMLSIRQGLEIDPYHQDLLQNLLFMASTIDNNPAEAVRAYALLYMLGNTMATDVLASSRLPTTGFKVFQGTMEIANQMNTLTAALKRKGISAQAVNYYNSYLGYDLAQDISFSDCRTQEEANLKAKAFAADMLSNYDIFHFHFGTTLTFDHSDLSLLEPLSKKRVMHYWGSDVRRLSVARKHNPYICVKNTDELKMVNDITKTAIHIQDCIVGDHELYLYVKDYFPRVHILRQAIDLSSYYPKPTQPNPRPLFVHAPTSPEVKGTEYILRAIDTLRQEYDFDFQLIQGMSHNQAKATYQQADLIIDQILIGSYGLLTVEAMAMGKPVVCWISEYMKDKYPRELPLLIANPDTITDVLRNVLNNQDMLPDLGLRGRVYAEQYHDANVVAEKLVSIYKGL